MVHHGTPAVLHRDEPWLHRHSENGALKRLQNASESDVCLSRLPGSVAQSVVSPTVDP